MAKNDISFNTNPAAAFAGFGGIQEQKKPTAAKNGGKAPKKLAKPDDIKDTHYTLEEAQKRMAICFNTLKKLIDAGEITRERHGRPYYIPVKDVEAYMKKHFGIK